MTNWEKAKQAAEEAMNKLGEFLQVFKEEENKGQVQLASLMPGEKFKTEIGNFIVLDQFGSATEVIAEKLFKEDVKFDDGCTDYNKSLLKKLCDTEILEEFTKVFGRENIVEHEVDLITVDGQRLYENAKCKICPLTFDEARKYNKYLLSIELSDWYWTCTPWSSKERGWDYSVAVVAPSGDILSNRYGNDAGFRPLCILKSNIFVSKED